MIELFNFARKPPRMSAAALERLEKKRAANRLYQKTHRAQINARKRKYRLKNPDKWVRYNREQYLKYRERNILYARAYRARKKLEKRSPRARGPGAFKPLSWR